MTNGNGKDFYVFNGTKWTKLIPQSDNMASICVDTNQMAINNTADSDVSSDDTGLEPIFFNKNGHIQVKLIVRYSAINGNAHFQLRASDDSGINKYPIVAGDFDIYASTQTCGVATSDWKDWNVSTQAYEIYLFAWVDNGANVTIESAYILVCFQ